MIATDWRRLLVPALVCAGLVAAAPAPGAVPPTFTANSTADEPDAYLGDGLCKTSAGDCTLRAAVQQANALGGATIDLLTNTVYTLTRFGRNEDQAVTGDLDLSSNITITVPYGGASVKGAPHWDDSIFEVTNAASTVVLSHIGIRDGSGGGCVSNRGTLTMTRVSVDFCSAGFSGGGIFNYSSGSVTLADSEVRTNFSTSYGGGIGNEGVMAVTNSDISANVAAYGAGIENSGRLTVTNSRIFNNYYAHTGGGINNFGTLTLTNSTISTNRADTGTGQGTGGGVYQNLGASMTVVNSTISSNLAVKDGGGIFNDGTANLVNDTIADNVADSDGNGSGDGGGIANVSGGIVSATNTIVGDNVDASATSKLPDCLGSLTSAAGFNLIEKTIGCALGGDTAGDITGRDPRLGLLQNNGGSTLTHALLLGDIKDVRAGPSPAIDSGNPSLFFGGCSSASQNGVTRPVDGNADGIARCDIGAYELPVQTFNLGTWALTPTDTTAQVGDRLSYSLTWTVPAPRGWRSLDSLQLRFLDDEQTALWIRFQEVPGSPGTFRVVDPESGRTGPSFAPGSPNRLESNAATVYLLDTSVDGPPGNRVTLTLALGFKPKAAGHSYDVQVLATDDTGAAQGFHRAGTVTISGR